MSDSIPPKCSMRLGADKIERVRAGGMYHTEDGDMCDTEDSIHSDPGR